MSIRSAKSVEAVQGKPTRSPRWANTPTRRWRGNGSSNFAREPAIFQSFCCAFSMRSNCVMACWWTLPERCTPASRLNWPMATSTAFGRGTQTIWRCARWRWRRRRLRPGTCAVRRSFRCAPWPCAWVNCWSAPLNLPARKQRRLCWETPPRCAPNSARPPCPWRECWAGSRPGSNKADAISAGQLISRCAMATIDEVRTRLAEGLVIPACPLAPAPGVPLDERRQRGLFRYYLAAGAGGLAVGVHTTQFSIRDPKVGLFRPVLELASAELGRSRREEALTSIPHSAFRTPPYDSSLPTSVATRIGIAGICGATRQAVAEASLVRELGFDAGLLSLGALQSAGEDSSEE